MSDRDVRHRARKRALGMRSTLAMLHEQEIATLDEIKIRLGLANRSDAIRVLVARTDLSSLTPADAEALERSSR